MPIYGAVVLLLPIVIGLVIRRAEDGALTGVAILLAIAAKAAYVETGVRRLIKADEPGLAGEERVGYLERAGGVSVAAG